MINKHFKKALVWLRSAWLKFRSCNFSLLPEMEILERAEFARRSNDCIHALILYDYLAEKFPKNPGHVANRDYIANCLLHEKGQIPAINTKKMKCRGKNLRLLHTMSFLGHPKERLLSAIEKLPCARDRSALMANLYAGEDAGSWQQSINSLLSKYGLRGLTLKESGFSPTVMHNISFSPSTEKPQDRGLVTICISAHNSAATLPYAIDSILRQDYQNFELYVVDDASTDDTGEVAKSYAVDDKRVVPILNTRNRGTYWNRNLALSLARGEFFTVLDADDLCHPQRIPLQLEFLHQNPAVVGVFGHWFRLETGGRLTYRNSWGGVFLHEAVATLLIRREMVNSRIGFYDPVKIASDTEYLERIKRVFGKESIQQIRKPLSIALAHAKSLTASQDTGIDVYFGLSKPRRDYRDAWMQWHKSSAPEQLYIPMPNKNYSRPFPAPDEIVVALD
jgi:hypothetical protein